MNPVQSRQPGIVERIRSRVNDAPLSTEFLLDEAANRIEELEAALAAPPPSTPQVSQLALVWRTEAVKHGHAANGCDIGDEEWRLHREASRVYKKCALDLDAALAKPGDS